MAGLLRPHERSALARATLTDTLTACVQAAGLAGIGVVTCDREVAELAESMRAEVLWEAQARGQSEAVARGGRECLRRGIASMLTMPGDVSAMLTAADVEALTAVGAIGRRRVVHGSQSRGYGDECPAADAARLPAGSVWRRQFPASSATVCGTRLGG